MFRSLRISHVEFRFPGSEKLGPSRNGRMERNFPVIPIFRNFRPTSRGTPKISERNSGKCLFHSLHNPEFPEFLVEWKAPLISRKPNEVSEISEAPRYTISKWLGEARLLIGHKKNPLYYCAQSLNSKSPVTFVCSYTRLRLFRHYLFGW